MSMLRFSIIVICVIGLCFPSKASYVTLKKDSGYIHSYSVDKLSNDTTFEESFEWLSYNANDTVIAARSKTRRRSFSYSGDTAITMAEQLDLNGNWVPDYRKFHIYKNGKVVLSYENEYRNGRYVEESSKAIYVYDSLNQLLLVEHQYLSKGLWHTAIKTVIEYTSFGAHASLIRYVGMGEDSLFSGGYHVYSYDNENKQELVTEYKDTNSIVIRSKTFSVYDNVGRLDSSIGCAMNAQGICVESYMSTYEYEESPEAYVQNRYRMVDGVWSIYSSTITYVGSGIYSNKPDSVIDLVFDSANAEGETNMKWSYVYTDLGDGVIHYAETMWASYEAGAWFYKKVDESWYHEARVIGIEELFEDESLNSNLKIYGYKQNIIISGVEGVASVYNIAGQQIHRSNISFGRNEIAVKGKGIYIVRVATGKGSVSLKVLIE